MWHTQTASNSTQQRSRDISNRLQSNSISFSSSKLNKKRSSLKNKFKLSTPTIHENSYQQKKNNDQSKQSQPPLKPVSIARSNEPRSSLSYKSNNNDPSQAITSYSINRTKSMTPKQINADSHITTNTISKPSKFDFNEEKLNKTTDKKRVEKKSYHKHTKKRSNTYSTYSNTKPIKITKASIPLPPPPCKSIHFQPIEPTIKEEEEIQLQLQQKTDNSPSSKSELDNFSPPEPSAYNHIQPAITTNITRSVHFDASKPRQSYSYDVDDIDVDQIYSDDMIMPQLLEADDPIPDIPDPELLNNLSSDSKDTIPDIPEPKQITMHQLPSQSQTSQSRSESDEDVFNATKYINYTNSGATSNSRSNEPQKNRATINNEDFKRNTMDGCDGTVPHLEVDDILIEIEEVCCKFDCFLFLYKFMHKLFFFV